MCCICQNIRVLQSGTLQLKHFNTGFFSLFICWENLYFLNVAPSFIHLAEQEHFYESRILLCTWSDGSITGCHLLVVVSVLLMLRLVIHCPCYHSYLLSMLDLLLYEYSQLLSPWRHSPYTCDFSLWYIIWTIWNCLVQWSVAEIIWILCPFSWGFLQHW